MDKYEQYVGTVLENRYRLTELVGKGGMAVVFKATDLTMNRTVAVKILNEENNDDEIAVKRFYTESKAIAMLSHPNIVAIFDVSPMNSVQNFIVMEYIDGITLKDYLDRKKILDWTEACHYTVQILSALQHAHSKGVIHRDIKPQNIMLLADGSIKVTDFGIAKISDTPSVTAADKAIGTVNYISPEQASGRPVDFHSDIYSVGVMLYEMVTGKLPFSAENSVSVAMMHVHDTPVPPSENVDSPTMIPIGLEQIILKSMNKNPADRFGSASSMQRALEYLIANPGIRFTERQKKEVHGDDAGDESTNRGSSSVTGISSVSSVKDTPHRKKRRKTTMLPIVAGVTLAFLIVVFVCIGRIVLDLFSGSNTKNEEIIIPNLIGEIYTKELESNLAAQNYKVTVEYTYSKMNKKNEIVRQNPDKLSRKYMTPGGIDLVLFVNKGDDDVSLKDYSVINLADARLELENLGLEIEVIEEYNDTILAGYIIRTEPEKGAALVRGDTITLYVSKGQEVASILMPNVEGFTYEDAEKKLIAEGISIGERTYAPSELEEGTVISTSIEPGTEIYPRATTVDIVVSKGIVTMPDIIGDTLDDACEKLNEVGITVGQYDYVQSSYPENTVVDASVAPGEIITEETANVVLVISLGKTVMPDLAECTYDEALNKLHTLGFYFIENVEVDSDLPKGTVVGTSIPAGTNIENASASITVYISKGEPEQLGDAPATEDDLEGNADNPN